MRGGRPAIDASCVRSVRGAVQMLIQDAMLTRDPRSRSGVRRCIICYDDIIKNSGATVIATLTFVDRVMALVP